MQYKKVLITGGCGFVGSNIAIKYKENHPGVEVVSFDNLKRRGSELNIERLKKNGVSFVHGDVRNFGDLESIDKTDLIIECSAECSVLAGYGSSARYLLDTNLYGAINCLELAHSRRADVIFLSTSRVYPIEKLNSLKVIEKDTRYELAPKQTLPGVSEKGISEDFPLSGARSFYGATKLSAELLLEEYIQGYGIRGVINRCGVLTGPWQMGKVEQGFVSLWIARHIYGGGLSYIGFGGEGKQVRDILHVDDLYDALEMEIRDMDAHTGEIYNIGGGNKNSISLKELSSLCEEITKNRISIKKVAQTRDADIIYYVTDYTRFNKTAGWTPKRDLNKIIEDIAGWVYENKELLSPALSGAV